MFEMGLGKSWGNSHCADVDWSEYQLLTLSYIKTLLKKEEFILFHSKYTLTATPPRRSLFSKYGCNAYDRLGNVFSPRKLSLGANCSQTVNLNIEDVD